MDSISSSHRRPRPDFGEEDAPPQPPAKKMKVLTVSNIARTFVGSLRVAAEQDAELSKKSLPALNKLHNLPRLTRVLANKSIQPALLHQGLLPVLTAWLQPLSDGTLPDVAITTAILTILADFDLPPAVGCCDEFVSSGLAKLIIFLARSDRETSANRESAKSLAHKWFPQMWHDDEEERLHLAPKPSSDTTQSGAVRTEATPLGCFVVRPQSKVNPEEIRAAARARLQRDKHRVSIDKKLQKLKAAKRKPLQATKLSAQGRGLMAY